MSCLLTQGATIDCINSKGGIRTLYIGDYNDYASQTPATVVAGAITAMTLATGKKLWTYNLEKQNASFSQDLKKSYDTGSLYYESKIDWNMKKISASFSVELSTMAQMRLIVMMLDNNGKHWITGLSNGLDLMTTAVASGKAFADLNGFTLGITGEEPALAYEVPSGVVATLIVPAV